MLSLSLLIYYTVTVLFDIFRQSRFESDRLRPIPCGGDQLTCERIRSAHISRMDGLTPEERLEGIFPFVEDFHQKMNYSQVC